jgi:hypothetical protein
MLIFLVKEIILILLRLRLAKYQSHTWLISDSTSKQSLQDTLYLTVQLNNHYRIHFKAIRLPYTYEGKTKFQNKIYYEQLKNILKITQQYPMV